MLRLFASGLAALAGLGVALVGSGASAAVPFIPRHVAAPSHAENVRFVGNGGQMRWYPHGGGGAWHGRDRGPYWRGGWGHRGYWGRGYYGYGGPYWGGYGYDPFVFGALGFATGALIGGAIASDGAYADAPAGDGWREACARKYRSFDWGSGTYLGYDGYRHPCRLP
jgi:hypothetical protein